MQFFTTNYSHYSGKKGQKKKKLNEGHAPSKRAYHNY